MTSAATPATATGQGRPHPPKPKLVSRPAPPSAPEKIRPDLNIEKWPAIWRPTHSKNNQPTVRSLTRSLPGGATATVELRGVAGLGDLTTEDQLLFYALVKNWESCGRPTAYTPYSARRISKILKKHWGPNTLRSITQSLRRLRQNPFTWTNAYHDGSSHETVRVLDTFTILSKLKIVEREKDGAVNRQVGYYRFDDFILRSLLNNYTKPVLLDVLLGFKSEIAQLIYTHVDLMLCGKRPLRQYERRTHELFLKDLGLNSEEYRYLSWRKRALEPAFVELQGVPISKGTLTVALEKTSDGRDYKGVFRRVPSRATARPQQDREYGSSLPSAHPAEDPQAVQLVAHFHKLFHGVDNAYPRFREISQATALLASVGFDRAKYVVDFSRSAAETTNYRPQTFGGILQYAARGIADYDRRQREAELGREHQAKLEAAGRQAEENHQRRLERLARLAPEERQALYEKVKTHLLGRYPENKRFWEARPQLIEGAIEAGMIRELEHQEQQSPHPDESAAQGL